MSMTDDKFIIFVKYGGVWHMWGTKYARLNADGVDQFLKAYDDVACVQSDVYFAIKEGRL